MFNLVILLVLCLVLIFVLLIICCWRFEFILFMKNLLKKTKVENILKAVEIIWIKKHDIKLPITKKIVGIDEDLLDKVKFLERTDFGLELSRDMLTSLAYRLVPMSFKKNTVVFNEKHYSKHLFIILEGSVIVYSINGTEICTLNKYNFFGEIELALELDNRNIAVITGDKPCLFLALNEADFLQLSQDTGFNRIMMDAARQRYELLVITGFINEN